MTVVITRPLDDAVGDAEELRKHGIETLIEPMLSIEPVPFKLPKLDDFQAILFTSGNAVRLFASETDRRDIPLYVVGKNTAAEAEARGFDVVLDANGTGDDLVVLVQKGIRDKSKPILHVRGADVAVPVDEMLKETGYKVKRVVAYKAHTIDHFSARFLEALKTGRIEAITFYSARTAENFLRLIEDGKYQEYLASIKALCISKAVLKCIQPYTWAETYTAETMNRDGMMALVREKTQQRIIREENIMSQKNSNSAKNGEAITNAEEVIERFGGIRPMAKKIDVAVTTVQGWKKRNTIPAARREQVLEAAESHNVDLSDIIQGAPESSPQAADESEAANENQASEVPRSKVVVSGSVPRAEKPAARAAQAGMSDLDEKLAATEKNAVTKSTWINVFLIVLAIGAVAVLLWPAGDERLSSLESDVDGLRTDVAEVKESQSFLSTLIPADLDDRIAALQEQASQAFEKAGEVSTDVLGEDAGTIEERVVKLGTHVSELTGSEQWTALLDRFQTLRESTAGQEQLNQTIVELNKLLAGMGENKEQLGDALTAARSDNAVVSETFQDVPPENLKAAALLLGMTQFRQSLNRDNQPFDEDLQLLLNLVGEDNPELTNALQRLAPQAEEGVLTPGGLSDQFKSLTGDIVVSSLKGEDVSFQEKASARFNDVFQVEKDGELITGTPTQATLAKTQNLLESGDVAGAITEMETLEGEQAEIAAPWLDEAKATLLAEQLKGFMNGSIEAATSGIDSLGSSGSQLIQNKELGINVLKRAPSPGQKNLYE